LARRTDHQTPQDGSSRPKRRGRLGSGLRIASYVAATIGLAPFFSELAGGNLTLESFYNQPSLTTADIDGIVVYTGSEGRVMTGLQLHIQSGAPLLISGVHGNTQLSDILAATGIDPQSVDPRRIALGYSAEDTVGNAQETAQWAARNNMRNVMVVTSQIHMPRAYMEARSALPDDVRITPYTVQRSFDVEAVLQEFAKLAGRVYIREYGEIFNLASNPAGDHPAASPEIAPRFVVDNSSAPPPLPRAPITPRSGS